MFTKNSKPYIYPILNRIVVGTGATGLQYDVYPMSIEGQSRFFINLVHGEDVVLEASVRTVDLPFIKALVDGTIDAAASYTLSDGTIQQGSDVISRIDAMLIEMKESYQHMVDVFTIMHSPTLYSLDSTAPPAPETDLGVDVNAIFNRLTKKNGKILPDT